MKKAHGTLIFNMVLFPISIVLFLVFTNFEIITFSWPTINAMVKQVDTHVYFENSQDLGTILKSYSNLKIEYRINSQTYYSDLITYGSIIVGQRIDIKYNPHNLEQVFIPQNRLIESLLFGALFFGNLIVLLLNIFKKLGHKKQEKSIQ